MKDRPICQEPSVPNRKTIQIQKQSQCFITPQTFSILISASLRSVTILSIVNLIGNAFNKVSRQPPHIGRKQLIFVLRSER